MIHVIPIIKKKPQLGWAGVKKNPQKTKKQKKDKKPTKHDCVLTSL